LEWVVIAGAATEAVAEVLVVDIRGRVGERLFRVHGTLLARLWIGSEYARARGRETSCAAIACEVPFGKYFDEVVVSMALDRASVADTRGFVGSVYVLWGRIAGKTRKDALLERPQHIRTRIKGLKDVCQSRSVRVTCHN